MAERWLRAQEIIDTVAEWTGLKAKDLTTSKRGSRRVSRGKVLLVRCLQEGLDSSQLEAVRLMGYTQGTERAANHLFKQDWDASEVSAVINLAKDRARA